MFQKKGVGTRRLKYRLPENPGILNSPHTSVRGNGLVKGHTYIKTLFTWSGGPRSSGVSFFCFVSPRA